MRVGDILNRLSRYDSGDEVYFSLDVREDEDTENSVCLGRYQPINSVSYTSSQRGLSKMIVIS